MSARQPFDLDGLVARTRAGPCFICRLIADDPDYAHHIVARDEHTIIFLSKYPTLPGYCLIAPVEHVEDLAEEMTRERYLALQAKVQRLSIALKRRFDAERIYMLSLGSQTGNAHLHVHVVPLPKGVPYDQQQYHALMAEHGVIETTEEAQATLAREIGAAYRATP